MTSDAKFRWFENMCCDGKIPPAHRLILGYCAIRYATESEGFIIRVRQQTIAENLCMARKTVNEAFRTGRERGWVEKVSEHRRGPGHHSGDTWRLRMPEWCNPNDTPYGEVLSNPRVTPLGQWSNPNGHNDVTQTPEWCNPPKASTSENVVPKGIGQGSRKGTEPQIPSCSKHPNGPDHDENCHQCKRVRQYNADQVVVEERGKAEEANALRLLKANCKFCGGTGFIDVDDNTVRCCDHGATNLEAWRNAQIG
jgi:hypothetical protein